MSMTLLMFLAIIGVGTFTAAALYSPLQCLTGSLFTSRSTRRTLSGPPLDVGPTVASALPILTSYRCARCQLPDCGVPRCFYLLASYIPLLCAGLSQVFLCTPCTLDLVSMLFLPGLVLPFSPVFCSRIPMTLFFLSQISPIKTVAFA